MREGKHLSLYTNNQPLYSLNTRRVFYRFNLVWGYQTLPMVSIYDCASGSFFSSDIAFWFLSYVIFTDSVAPRNFKQGNYNGKSGEKNEQLCLRCDCDSPMMIQPLSFFFLTIQVLSEG